MKPWCTYRTTHPSGLLYEGKGQTARVLSGAYKGSGIRFRLALTLPTYEEHTWTTIILEDFDTEEEAYLAEEKLVTLESLADPLRLNMHQGGTKGKYQTHGRLLKKMAQEKKKETAALKKERVKIKEAKAKEKLAELKKQLKDKK